MDREKTVQALIANEKTHWTKDDTDALMAMSEKSLQALQDQASEEPAVEEDTPEDKPEGETAEPTANAEPKPKPKAPTLEEYVANAPAPIREVLNNSMGIMAREKAKLIGVITANERNTFSKEMLASKTLDELQAIAVLAASTEKEETPPSPNYIGQGPAQTTTNTEEPLPLPVLNFDAK